MARQVCVVRGSINIDEFFYVSRIVRPGETLSSTRYERRGGGKGANQAVAIARASAPVVLVGAIGPDGDWLVGDLTRFGVDTSKIISSTEEPTGRAIIQLTPQGENSIILHRGANYSTLVPISPAGHLEYTHLLLQNEIPLESTLAYLSHAHQTQRASFFNPSPLPTQDQIRHFPWGQLDWLIVNEGEALDLLTILEDRHSAGSTVADRIEEIPGQVYDRADRVASTRQILRNLHLHPMFSSAVNIVCTLGSLGVLALVPRFFKGSENVGITHVPAADIDQNSVRDTTGAGDCFTGYLVAGLMEFDGLSGEGLTEDVLIEILQQCVEASGLCVQRLGAMGSIPSRKEVRDLVRERSLV